MTAREDIDVKERPGGSAALGTDRPGAPATPAATGGIDGARSTGSAPMVEIHASTILRILAWSIGAIIVLHLLVMTARFGFGYEHMRGLVPLFNLESEKNVPTFFSSMQLFVAALLLAFCAGRHRLDGGRYFKHWAGLSAIFLFLALDESALIHEKTSNVLKEFLGTSGIFYYAWVIPFGLFALVVFLTYIRFLLALPRSTALIFMASGTVFVMGAIGMELIESRISEAGHYSSFGYMVLVTIEETLEMTGIWAFIYGLLRHLTGDGRAPGLSLVK